MPEVYAFRKRDSYSIGRPPVDKVEVKVLEKAWGVENFLRRLRDVTEFVSTNARSEGVLAIEHAMRVEITFLCSGGLVTEGENLTVRQVIAHEIGGSRGRDVQQGRSKYCGIFGRGVLLVLIGLDIGGGRR